MTYDKMTDVERDISGETVCGFRVAAYRETHPEHGARYGHHYSEHWSTPNSRHPNVKVERLFTEDQLRAALQSAAPVEDDVREALATLHDWTLHFNKHGYPKSADKARSMAALIERLSSTGGQGNG